MTMNYHGNDRIATELAARLQKFRQNQSDKVLAMKLPEV